MGFLQKLHMFCKEQLTQNAWPGLCWDWKTTLDILQESFPEEGGCDHVIDTINWYSKIKKIGYKLIEQLYGQSSGGCNGSMAADKFFFGGGC